jgi:hypothetical protein
MNYHIFDNEVKKKESPFILPQDDFWRPKMSNDSKPLNNKHENYIFDKNATLFYEQQKMQQRQQQPLYTDNRMAQHQEYQQPFHDNFMQPLSTRLDHTSYSPASCLPNFQNSQNNHSSVQRSMQDKQITNSIMTNFETLNGHQEINHFLERNPVNTRRDQLEKIRNSDRHHFLEKQGGNLHNFTNFQTQNTRKVRNDINTNSYVPMGKTMAIPKENL